MRCVYKFTAHGHSWNCSKLGEVRSEREVIVTDNTTLLFMDIGCTGLTATQLSNQHVSKLIEFLSLLLSSLLE